MPDVYVFRVCLHHRPAGAHSFADCIADLSARINDTCYVLQHSKNKARVANHVYEPYHAML